MEGACERDFSSNDELMRLGRIYEETRAQLEKSVEREQREIMVKSVARLDAIKTELNRSGKLTDAKRAEELRQKILTRMKAEEIEDLEPSTFRVRVEATQGKSNPLVTKALLEEGQRFRIIPNDRDGWSGGGSKRGEFCDFRGYEGSGAGWMNIRARIGNGEAFDVDPEAIRTAKTSGSLHLFAGDGNAVDNVGETRVEIVVNPSPEDD